MPQLLEEWHRQRPVRSRAGPEPEDGSPPA
jgi:hypothetical protein